MTITDNEIIYTFWRNVYFRDFRDFCVRLEVHAGLDDVGTEDRGDDGDDDLKDLLDGNVFLKEFHNDVIFCEFLCDIKLESERKEVRVEQTCLMAVMWTCCSAQRLPEVP